MGFYAVISNSNGNARVIVITCHSPALLISSAGASIANLKQETNSLNSLCNSAMVHGSQKLRCVCVCVCLLCGFECPQTTLESLKSFNFERWTREENATWRKTEGLLSFRFLFIATIFLAVVWPNNAVIWCGAVLNYSLCFEACLCESVCVIHSLLGIQRSWNAIKHPADRQSCQSAAAIHQWKCGVFILSRGFLFQMFIFCNNFDNWQHWVSR